MIQVHRVGLEKLAPLPTLIAALAKKSPAADRPPNPRLCETIDG
jgi:hypothetical protein